MESFKNTQEQRVLSYMKEYGSITQTEAFFDLGMGSLAHVHLHYVDLPSVIASYQNRCNIYGTMLDGADIYSTQLSANGIIVMGNEGNGITDSIREMVSHKLLIPDFHEGKSAESLNVAIATAIVCSEFRRRS